MIKDKVRSNEQAFNQHYLLWQPGIKLIILPDPYTTCQFLKAN
jgi:hypothetical protein